MISRVAVGVLASVPVLVGTVHAAEGATEASAPPSGKKLKPCDFPLYGAPTPIQLEYEEEKATDFRKNISVVRQAVWDYMDTMEDTTRKVKEAYQVSKKYSDDMLEILRKDSSILHRAGIITVAGLGGVVAGYKGGVMTKTLYAGAGMITAATICYPNQAVDITTTSWDKTKHKVKDWWKDAKKGTPAAVVVKEKEVPKAESKDTTLVAEAGTTKIDQSKVDHGQSHPDDKDLYTTRGK